MNKTSFLRDTKTFFHSCSLFLVVCGGAAAVLGGLSLLDWHLNQAVLVRILPTCRSTDYGTAWGFVCAGLAFILLAWNRKRWVLILSAVVFVWSSLRLIGHWTDIGLNLDRMLFKGWVSEGALCCCHVPAITILSFVCLSGALVILCMPGRIRLFYWVLGGAVAFICAVSVDAMLDYITGAIRVHEQIPFANLTLFDTAGWFILSAGIVLYLWTDIKNWKISPARWFSFVVFASTVSAVLFQWLTLVTIERQAIERDFSLASSSAAKLISTQVESRIDALVRMARRWELRDKPVRREWESDALLYVQHYPGYQAIAWVDPALHVRWIVPKKGNEAAQGLCRGFEETRKGVLEKARQLRQTTLTHCVDLVTGQKGFLANVPVFHGTEFRGYITGVFQYKDLLNSVLGEKILPRYSIAVIDQGKGIYCRGADHDCAGKEMGPGADVDLHGVVWRVHAWLKPGIIAAERFDVPRILLVLGIVVAVSMTIMVYFGQMAREYAGTIASINQALERDIVEQKSTKEELQRNYDVQHTLNTLLQLSSDNSVSLDEFLRRAFDLVFSIAWLSLESRGGILLVEGKPDVLVMKVQRGLSVPIQNMCAQVPFGKCLCGRAALTGKVQFADHLDDRHEVRYEGIAQHGHYCVPILSSGKILGVINMYIGERCPWHKETEAFLVAVANTLAGVVERKRAEEKLREALADLRGTQQELVQAEKMQVVGRLASGVAHEVKNPLAVILQGVGYLSKKIPAGDEHLSPVLRDMQDAVERADEIVHGLLDFSSISRLEITPHDLNAVVEKALSLVKHSLDKYHIRVVKGLTEGIPDVQICPNRIEQVFVNVFMNAIQAMGDGGKLSVRTYVKEPDALAVNGAKDAASKEDVVFSLRNVAVVAEIEDEGPGILPSVLDKIFDPFFTTKRDKGGTGLGMSIVKNIMDMHDGKIRVENRAEGGTRVVLTFKG